MNGGRNSRRQPQPRSTPLTHDSYPAIVAQTRWRGACSSLCRRLAHGVVGAPVPAGSSRRVAGRASLTARGRRTARRTRCTSRCAPAKPSGACAPTVRFPPSATPSPWPLAGAFGSFSSVFRTTISISSSRPMIRGRSGMGSAVLPFASPGRSTACLVVAALSGAIAFTREPYGRRARSEARWFTFL